MGDGQPTGAGESGTGLKAGQLRVRDIWALGVGIVVCGQYFGWNLGLKDNGPVAMLIASLVVCLLFLAWVLTLSELAVAMPRAGGPLDYGRRAGGRWLGFLMGWSMFLECLFGGVATSLAAGKYVAFVIAPDSPDPAVAVAVGLSVVFAFFLLQARGVKEQARALTVMTWLGLAGLALFWVASLTNFSWARVWAEPPIPAAKGWGAVLDAIPFALWWLIIIEAAALAAEESRDPARTVPRGLTLSILTVIVLVVVTTVTACGALPFQEIAEKDGKAVDYPLAEVVRRIPAGTSPLLVYGFGAVALFGLLASYHGLLFGSGRQLFALGRGGYLPRVFGAVNDTRRTPVTALAACSLVTAALVVSNLWFDQVIASAVLVAGLAALVLYVLSMGSLWRLRRREPEALSGYRAPLGVWLPLTVVTLSAVALLVYQRIDGTGLVIPVAVGVYAAGVLVFAVCGRTERRAIQPTGPLAPAKPLPRWKWSHRVAVAVLVIAVAVVGAVAVTALGGPDLLGPPDTASAAAVLAVVAVAILAVAGVELRITREGVRDDAP